MKFSTVIAFGLVALAFANPIPAPEAHEAHKASVSAATLKGDAAHNASTTTATAAGATIALKYDSEGRCRS